MSGLGDALLTAEAAPSLPWLSLQPAFRRSWGMACQALAEGRVDAEALRDTLLAHRPADWPCVSGRRRLHDPAALGGDQPGPAVPATSPGADAWAGSR